LLPPPELYATFPPEELDDALFEAFAEFALLAELFTTLVDETVAGELEFDEFDELAGELGLELDELAGELELDELAALFDAELAALFDAYEFDEAGTFRVDVVTTELLFDELEELEAEARLA